jgi:hypothetical protein
VAWPWAVALVVTALSIVLRLRETDGAVEADRADRGAPVSPAAGAP